MLRYHRCYKIAMRSSRFLGQARPYLGPGISSWNQQAFVGSGSEAGEGRLMPAVDRARLARKPLRDMR
jgi:hypothetical protein